MSSKKITGGFLKDEKSDPKAAPVAKIYTFKL
jgi:hypothetical protein